jgi:hypothetical protein
MEQIALPVGKTALFRQNVADLIQAHTLTNDD